MTTTPRLATALLLALTTTLGACDPADTTGDTAGGGGTGDTQSTGGAGGQGAQGAQGGGEAGQGGTGGTGGSGGGTAGAGGEGGAGGSGGGGGFSGCPAVTLGVATDALHVVADSTHVYWTGEETGAPMRAPICGGSPAVPLATADTDGESELLVDDTHVYWRAPFGDGLYRVTKQGGAPEIVCSEVGGGLGQSATHIYWYEAWYDQGNQAAVRRVPKTGGAPETVAVLASDPHPAGRILTDDTYVYWLAGTSSGGVYRAPLGGGEPELLGWGDGIPKSITADATDFYWIGNFSNQTVLNRLPKIGGAGALVASLPGSPQQIAVNGSSLFVSVQAYLPNPSSKQGILKLPKEGGAYTWIVSGETAPYGVAADDTYLFYTHNTFDGEVNQIPAL